MTEEQRASLLDVCLADIHAGRRTLEQCLADHPTDAEELAALLPLAVFIRPPDVVLDPARRLAARHRLVEAIHEERRQPGWVARLVGLLHGAGQLRLATAAFVALMLVVMSGGAAVVAAQNTLPGEPLYPLKLATEQARVATARDEEARARTYLDIAGRRLHEVERALDAGKGEPAATAAEAYVSAIAQVETEIRAAQTSGREVPDLRQLADEHRRREQDLSRAASGASTQTPAPPLDLALAPLRATQTPRPVVVPPTETAPSVRATTAGAITSPTATATAASTATVALSSPVPSSSPSVDTPTGTPAAIPSPAEVPSSTLTPAPTVETLLPTPVDALPSPSRPPTTSPTLAAPATSTRTLVPTSTATATMPPTVTATATAFPTETSTSTPTVRPTTTSQSLGAAAQGDSEKRQRAPK